MELRQLAYVVAVAEESSFTKAAARAHVAQPAISQQIAQLERELGQRLFDRSDRRVRLTPAGEAFLPYARTALEATAVGRDAVASLHGVLAGRLIIGTIPCPPDWLNARLAEFARRHPAVRLTVHVASPETLADEVATGSLDTALIGVMNPRLPAGPAGQRLRPSLASQTVSIEPLVVGVTADHPLAQSPGVTLTDLKDESFVTLTSGTGLRAVVEAAAAAAGFTIDVKAEATDLVTLTDLVAQGIGVGVFPESVTVRARGQLVAIPLIRPRLKRHLVLVWHRQRTSAVTKAFLEVAQAVDDGTRR